MHKLIPIEKVVANPFRKMDRYPIDEEKIAMLIGSMERTGFWENIVGRERDDFVELAYGHHRWVAYERKYGKSASIGMILKDLDDKDMLRMMADENAQEYGGTTGVLQETIRAVVEAYAAGKIQLPKPERIDKETRYAPRFRRWAQAPAEVAYPYTAQTIADFLGWRKPNGTPRDTLRDALVTLEGVEDGVVYPSDLSDLATRTAEAITREAVAIKRSYVDSAKVSGDSERVKAAEKAGRIAARKAARAAAAELSEGSPRKHGENHGFVGATERMKAKRSPPPLAKALPTVEKFVLKLTTDLRAVLGPKDTRRDKINQVIKFKNDIDEDTKKNLVAALGSLSERCRDLTIRLTGSDT
jgi:hypothetical protein